jgi:hypothetical protein
MSDVTSRERGEVDRAVGCAGYSIGPATSGGGEYLDIANRWIETAVDAVLSGEPENTGAIEGSGVEIGVGAALGQRIDANLVIRRIYADNGVQPAVGDPGSAIGVDDDPVRRRAGSEEYVPRLSGLGVEITQGLLPLCGVPDAAARAGAS